MLVLIKKLPICVILLCFIQNINSLDLDAEAQEKVTNLIGEKQLALRSYLEQVKSKTQGFDYNSRSTISAAKASLTSEVDKIITDIKSDTGIKSDQKPCIDQMNQGIVELTQQSETIHNDCALSAKPNLLVLHTDITRHAEFQSKIGAAPKKCLDSNNDVPSIIKCIEKSTNDIGKEMKESENQVNSKIDVINQQMEGMQSSLASCQAKGLEELRNKSKEIKNNFRQCAKS